MSKTDIAHVQETITKLDADNYGAEDQDGVTQTLMGSGNLNYLTLQSQQNDLMSQNVTAGENNAQEVALANLASGISSGHGASSLVNEGAESFSNGGLSDDGAQGLGDTNSFGQGTAALVPTLNSGAGGAGFHDGGQDSRSSIFSSSSSSISDRTDIQTAINGTNGSNGDNGLGLHGGDGANGSSGNNGNNGRDGHDGHTPDVPPDGGPDVDIHIDTDITGPININPIVDVILDPIEAIVGDIDVIVNTDLHLGALLQTVHDVLNNPVGTVNTVLDGVTGLVDSLLPHPTNGDTDLHVDLGVIGPLHLNPLVDVILDPVENIVGDVDINVLPDLNSTNGSIDLDVNTIVADLPFIDTVTHLDLPVLQAVGETLDTLPQLDAVLDNPQATVETIVGDIGNIVGSLLGGGNGEGASDMDLHVDLGILPPIDVTLDPVEYIVGDIDLDLTNHLNLDTLPALLNNIDMPQIDDIVANPQGAVETTITDAHDTVSDISNLDATGEALCDITGDFLNDLSAQNPVTTVESILNSDGLQNLLGGGPQNGDGENDTDLVIDPQISVLGITTPEVSVDTVLDPVESITGDIDIHVDAAIDALNGGGVQDLLTISGTSTGTGEGGIWPQNPVTAVVDNVFDTMLGGSDAATALPDPAGTVAEGLGILNLVDTGHHGSGHHGVLGGLFG